MQTQREMRASERLPDLDAEQEVDLGRYWRSLLERWWLLLAGLIVGVIAGYLLSLGGTQVYTAKATIYLGQPLSITGTSSIQSPNTNPNAVRAVVLAPWAQRRAEAAAGLRTGALRGHVAIQATVVTLATRAAGQNPLVSIIVDGREPAKIARAADALAELTMTQVAGGYVATKIKTLKAQLAAVNETLASVDQTINRLREAASSSGLSTVEKLIIVVQLNAQTQQRGQVVDQQTTTRQLLALAQNVEQPKLISPATAEKTTARSRRNSIIVGGLIGLLLGIGAALLWEPLTRLSRGARD
ncbi:MAG: Wzz/FepE/Etk N-terminal domain-containing protein [Actinomycetota bacterium]|nr:Wzz/FepE/Etk N-terminal domain-containing protein [Actinomycetota bacterium]